MCHPTSRHDEEKDVLTSETMNLLEAKALEGVARVHRAIWILLDFRLP